MSKGLKVIFMGTPEFALSALNAIVKSGHDVIAVYSQPPRPAGRGQALTKSPVHARAEELGIKVYNPLSLKKDEAAQKEFADLGADVAVVAAYGLILPQTVLDAPKFGCINIHGSLLPRWRGAAPIQHAIWAGDNASGIGIMQMEAGLDTGPVLMEGRVAITKKTTTPSLYQELSDMGADLIVKTLNLIAEGTPPVPHAQSDVGATYASMLKKEDGKINWQKSADEIDRQVRALNPAPGVWSSIAGKRVKILEVEIVDAKGEAGQILDKNLTVACGSGALRIITLQPENKGKMTGLAFMNGHAKEGDRFE